MKDHQTWSLSGEEGDSDLTCSLGDVSAYVITIIKKNIKTSTIA